MGTGTAVGKYGGSGELFKQGMHGRGQL